MNKALAAHIVTLNDAVEQLKRLVAVTAEPEQREAIRASIDLLKERIHDVQLA